ncbi:hypothetical protein LZL87_013875 [Fusarium oxysporum]|nr:hypothetical protein LZL87_013875 [Fusarium oxysporum]
MALPTNPDISAALFSTTSTANSDLDTGAGFNRSDDSTEANADISSTAHSGRRQRTGWVWEHGYDIEKDSSSHRFWLCKECHQTKAAITHMYDAASTSQANGHMEDVHRINRGGKMSPRRKKQRTLFDMVGLDAHQGKDQAVINAFITSFCGTHSRGSHKRGWPSEPIGPNPPFDTFDPLRFQQVLIRWVACDNVHFNTLESPYFQELIEYANSAIIKLGSLPTYNTRREWIIQTFNRHKGVTSRKFASLLGLTVHFLDDEGKFHTFLLGLLQIKGHHYSKNLAGRVSEIIYEYSFEGRIRYFITDNAESNNTCLKELTIKLGFNKQYHRLQCCRHIINLIARSILFRTDADAFEEDYQADKELQDKIRL